MNNVKNLSICLSVCLMQTILMNTWASEINQATANQAATTAGALSNNLANELGSVSLVLEPKVATEPAPKQINSANDTPKNLLNDKSWGKAGAASNTHSNSHRWWT